MSVRLAGTALREIRIHVCQKSPASAGVRAFIENDYVGIKKANPQFPILIREASGIVPRWEIIDFWVKLRFFAEFSPDTSTELSESPLWRICREKM